MDNSRRRFVNTDIPCNYNRDETTFNVGYTCKRLTFESGTAEMTEITVYKQTYLDLTCTVNVIGKLY